MPVVRIEHDGKGTRMQGATSALRELLAGLGWRWSERRLAWTLPRSVGPFAAWRVRPTEEALAREGVRVRLLVRPVFERRRAPVERGTGGPKHPVKRRGLAPGPEEAEREAIRRAIRDYLREHPTRR